MPNVFGTRGKRRKTRFTFYSAIANYRKNQTVVGAFIHWLFSSSHWHRRHFCAAAELTMFDEWTFINMHTPAMRTRTCVHGISIALKAKACKLEIFGLDIFFSLFVCLLNKLTAHWMRIGAERILHWVLSQRRLYIKMGETFLIWCIIYSNIKLKYRVRFQFVYFLNVHEW